VRRIDLQQRGAAGERQARLDELRRQAAALTGDEQRSRATVARLTHELELRVIRAPVAGRIAELGGLQMGVAVRAGARLGAVLPHGELRVVAQFAPPAALGRIQPGMPARLRLDGFPWAQYGAVPALVSRVADEVRDGAVRVELEVQGARPARIPLQHGLPGAVEVEIEQARPIDLLLRAAGKALAPPPEPQADRALLVSSGGIAP
jgi:membrane fusion protein (multidrug efflux system)